MLLLDERIRSDGSHARTWAERVDDGAAIVIRDDDGTTGRLPVLAVDRVMCRFGRPLEEDARLDGGPWPASSGAEGRRGSIVGESLDLAGGHRLRRYRFHAIVDAEARDYLVWERPGGEPLAAIGTMVAAALRFLIQPAPSGI